MRKPIWLYDLIIFLFVEFLLLVLYKTNPERTAFELIINVILSFACIFSCRFIGRIYRQIWRYGGIQCYILLLFVDGVAFLLNLILSFILPIARLPFARQLSIACINLLMALAIRMLYRYAYKCGNNNTFIGKVLNWLLLVFAGSKVQKEKKNDIPKVKIAIIGAGRIGVALADDLLNNENSPYLPRCFIDINVSKASRSVHGLPVFLNDESVFAQLNDLDVQEVVLAISNIDEKTKKETYRLYESQGFKVKLYDYPIMQSASDKRQLRAFDIEELLFRKTANINIKKVYAYYKDKVILITGGGGSIGSELCRQLAKMSPKQIIILDICENGAYDVQQELRIAYGDKLDLRIEIASITNKSALARVFEAYHPNIVINAAAHKHVPLMEHNCIEAVENNVFGTKNIVDLCEEYKVERFLMVSTDKAVNPTNVMGATKRMCEMIVQSASTHGTVKYSSTRFGNVLGSAGSVIPLFRKQIANGGPVTLTDKRIIRYFMTIPEASQLVLESGAIANNGELFVLDMGQPIKILDLAESMIALSGVKGIEIKEIGLRPGEKLYEELLIKKEDLDKTENSLIFVERDKPLCKAEIDEKLDILRAACRTGDDDAVREALKQVVPTYKSPEEVNKDAEDSDEMKSQKEF